MTGYGQVHGSFGYAMATQNMYNSMQNIMTMTRNCQSLERQFGRAKTLEVNDKCKYYLKGANTGAAATSSTSATPSAAADQQSAPKYYGRYRRDPSVNMAVTISNTLFETADERAQLKQVIEAVQGAYLKEAAAKGWSNNFASGMTFFMVAMSTVYHDSAEPSDETVKAIYEAANQSIDSVPDFAKASNKDKTTINDLFVGFSALPLATYMEAKQSGDAETLKTARTLAGEMIKLVLKTDPEKLKF